MKAGLEGPLLRPKDAAAYIGVSKSTFYRMIGERLIPRPLRIIGNTTGFPKAWLDHFISTLEPVERGEEV